MRFPGERERVIEGLTERGIGTLVYYPVPVHRQPYLQSFVPGADDLDLPVTNRLSDEVLSIPVRPNLTEDELEAVIGAVCEVATPSDGIAAVPVRPMTAPLRVGLAGLGAMGRNHLRHLSSREGCILAAVADPAADLLADAVAKTGAAAGFAYAVAMINEAELDAVVIATPTTAHAPLGLAAIERGLPVLIEKPRRATWPRASSSWPRPDGEASRSRWATWSGSTPRYSSSAAGSRAAGSDHLLDHQPPRRPVPGPHPRRGGHDRPRDARRRHPLVDRRRAADARVRRLAQRLHASHEDLLFGLLHYPSGATGMLDVNWLTPAKRRQLSVVGEAGMFELDYLTQRLTFTSADVGSPTLIEGYATTFEGNVGVLDVDSREPLAAELDAFLAIARDGGRPVVDGEDGLWAVAIASALLSAAADRRPVEIGGLLDEAPIR